LQSLQQLFYSAAVFNSVRYRDECQILAFLRCQDHAFGTFPAKFDRLKVRYDKHFLADDILRFILRADTGYNLAFLIAEVHPDLQQLIGFFDTFRLDDCAGFISTLSKSWMVMRPSADSSTLSSASFLSGVISSLIWDTSASTSSLG